MSKVTRLDYCQFLLRIQTNYDYTDCFSYDAVHRYLRGEKLTARLLGEQDRDQIVSSACG